MTSREKERLKLIVNYLLDLYHQHPKNGNQASIPIPREQFCAVAGASRLSRSLMYHLNEKLSEDRLVCRYRRKKRDMLCLLKFRCKVSEFRHRSPA